MSQNGRHRVDPADVAVPGDGGFGQYATGIRVTSRDQLDEAMGALFASAGPALLCVE